MDADRLIRPERAEARLHRYRIRILEELARHAEPVSARTLHATMREGVDRIGLSTIYRELHALADEGRIRIVHLDNEVLYRCSGADLLVCDRCGRILELGRRLPRAGSVDGFFEPTTALVVHGRCRACITGPDSARPVRSAELLP